MNLSSRNERFTYFRTALPNQIWDALGPLAQRSSTGRVLAYLRKQLVEAAVQLSLHPDLMEPPTGEHERTARRPPLNW